MTANPSSNISSIVVATVAQQRTRLPTQLSDHLAASPLLLNGATPTQRIPTWRQLAIASGLAAGMRLTLGVYQPAPQHVLLPGETCPTYRVPPKLIEAEA
jgi:hypothetical protein